MERVEEKLQNQQSLKEEIHGRFIDGRKSRLQQEEDRRQNWLNTNTQVLNMRREDKVQRLDNKFESIENTRIQGEEETSDVIENRLSLRQDLIRRKEH